MAIQHKEHNAKTYILKNLHFLFIRFSIFFILLFSILLSACSNRVYGAYFGLHNDYLKLIKNKRFEDAKSEMDTIIGIEDLSEPPSKKILSTGRKLAIEDKVIIKGNCWNWVNEVFNRAGYSKNKKIVFKSKISGPYADINLILPGDWLYYINHSFRGSEHSGIFVYWKDYENKIGVILSYAGRNRSEPGRYLSYDLKNVYYITRAIEN